jgi:hypothetical protein
MIRTTHTYAELEVSEATYKEIKEKLKDAGYDHCFMDDGAVNMIGIALVMQPPAKEVEMLDPTDVYSYELPGGESITKKEIYAKANVPGTNSGHGWVWTRPDGVRARCIGAGFCRVCATDALYMKLRAAEVAVHGGPEEQQVVQELVINPEGFLGGTHHEVTGEFIPYKTGDGPTEEMTVHWDRVEDVRAEGTKAFVNDMRGKINASAERLEKMGDDYEGRRLQRFAERFQDGIDRYSEGGRDLILQVAREFTAYVRGGGGV